MEERQVTVEGTARPTAGTVRRRRNPEPGGVRRHLSAPGGAARPVPAEAHTAVAQPRGRGLHPRAPPRRLRSTRSRPRRECKQVAGAAELDAGAAVCCHSDHRAGKSWAMSSTSAVRPRSSPVRCCSVSSPTRARRRCWRRRRLGHGSRAATTSPPDDVKSAHPADAATPGGTAAQKLSSKVSPADGVLDGVLASVPVPPADDLGSRWH